MRKVVDTNFLKSDKLQEYLADPNNSAVIPDFVVMECSRTLRVLLPSHLLHRVNASVPWRFW